MMLNKAQNSVKCCATLLKLQTLYFASFEAIVLKGRLLAKGEW